MNTIDKLKTIQKLTIWFFKNQTAETFRF